MTIKKVKVKVNADIGGKKSGDEFDLEFVNNTPVNEFWRRRLGDSKFDNCMEVLTKNKVIK